MSKLFGYLDSKRAQIPEPHVLQKIKWKLSYGRAHTLLPSTYNDFAYLLTSTRYSPPSSDSFFLPHTNPLHPTTKPNKRRVFPLISTPWELLRSKCQRVTEESHRTLPLIWARERNQELGVLRGSERLQRGGTSNDVLFYEDVSKKWNIVLESVIAVLRVSRSLIIIKTQYAGITWFSIDGKETKLTYTSLSIADERKHPSSKILISPLFHPQTIVTIVTVLVAFSHPHTNVMPCQTDIVNAAQTNQATKNCAL